MIPDGYVIHYVMPETDLERVNTLLEDGWYLITVLVAGEAIITYIMGDAYPAVEDDE